MRIELGRRKLKVELIGFDSIGVRSMATFIETPDISIFIDPAVSLAPRRFSLPPHELEWRRLNEVASAISRRASEADMIVITHYHYDHHDPGKYVPLDIYDGKLLVIKDPKNKINYSQRMRSARFLKLVKGRVKDIVVGEERKLVFGKTTVEISPPYPHGINDRLGYVIQIYVSDGDRSLLFSSDVEGPVDEGATDFIIGKRPDVLILDGPPTYLSGTKFPEEAIRKARDNISRILRSSVEMVVADHHLLRDLKYVDFIAPLNEGGGKVLTAAEFMGREPELLEAQRPRLYGLRL
ncbi:MAG: hypothetical protein J7L55_03360 [Desulfurococcales archaeon]|nr:hypothetical protein [Desulfurococcales archaeon]